MMIVVVMIVMAIALVARRRIVCWPWSVMVSRWRRMTRNITTAVRCLFRSRGLLMLGSGRFRAAWGCECGSAKRDARKRGNGEFRDGLVHFAHFLSALFALTKG